MNKKTKKIDQLIGKYDDMKVVQLIIHASGAKWFFWFTIAMMLPSYIFLFRFIWTAKLSDFFLTFLFIILGVIAHLIAVNKSNNYVRSDDKFTPYQTEFKLKFWAFSYESFISEYRFDAIERELVSLNYHNHIDDVVSVLEADAVKIFDYMWKPVLILGVILFPLISEYVGFKYNVILQVKSASVVNEKNSNWVSEVNVEGINTLITLIPLMIFTGIFIWFLVFIVEKLFLTKVNDRKNLIKLLKQIKMG